MNKYVNKRELEALTHSGGSPVAFPVTASLLVLETFDSPNFPSRSESMYRRRLPDRQANKVCCVFRLKSRSRRELYSSGLLCNSWIINP